MRASPLATAVMAALLVLAALHVLRVQYTATSDGCTDATALRDLPIFARAHHYQQTTDPMRSRLMQWTEGAFRKVGGGDQKLRFRLIRTDDLAPFFGPPLGFIPSVTMPSDERRIEPIEVDGDVIPAHIRINHSDHSRFFVAYVYALGSRPEKWPAEAALMRALRSPWASPEPLSMLVAESTLDEDVVMSERRDVAMQWVSDAWREFAATCGS